MGFHRRYFSVKEGEREKDESELLEYFRGKIRAFSCFSGDESVDVDSISIDEIYELLDGEYRMSLWI